MLGRGLDVFEAVESLVHGREAQVRDEARTPAREPARPWDLVDDSQYRDADYTLRPRIDLTWVADTYWRQGVGATLVQALANGFGSPIVDVARSTPINRSGRQLTRQLSPGDL